MEKNKLIKRIAYCYETSRYHEEFENYGYYVQLTIKNIEGSGQCSTYADPSAYQGCVYRSIKDPELLQVFKEADGEIDTNTMYQDWLAYQVRN